MMLGSDWGEQWEYTSASCSWLLPPWQTGSSSLSTEFHFLAEPLGFSPAQELICLKISKLD